MRRIPHLIIADGLPVVVFETTRATEGRPRSTAKHVAVALADDLLRGRGHVGIDKKLVNLFHFAAERSVKRARQAGRKTMGSGVCVVITGGVTVHLEDPRSLCIQDGLIRINGKGWIWCEGDKTALYGRLSGKGEFTPF